MAGMLVGQTRFNKYSNKQYDRKGQVLISIYDELASLHIVANHALQPISMQHENHLQQDILEGALPLNGQKLEGCTMLIVMYQQRKTEDEERHGFGSSIFASWDYNHFTFVESKLSGIHKVVTDYNQVYIFLFVELDCF